MTLVDDAEELRLQALADLDVLGSAPEERFDRIVRLCQRLFGVETAAVNLVTRDTQWTKASIGLQLPELPRSESFCSSAVSSGDTLVVEDLTADPRFAHYPAVREDPRLRFYAGQPLQAPGGHLVGTLCLLDSRPRVLSPADRALLRDLALWVQKELAIDEELERAADVQRGLLPRSAPDLADYDLGGRCQPSRLVGGDLYDWYPLRDGGLVLTLADVMGKGMPAAIMAATLRAVLRATSRGGDLVGAVEAGGDAMETDFADAAAFATVFHARLDPTSGEVDYVDAGHGLAFVVRADGTLERPSVRGLPVGAVPGTTWTAERLRLEVGDTLVVASDGLLDLHADGAAVERAVTAAAVRGTGAQDVVDELLAPARSVGQEDDLTAVVLRRSS